MSARAHVSAQTPHYMLLMSVFRPLTGQTIYSTPHHTAPHHHINFPNLFSEEIFWFLPQVTGPDVVIGCHGLGKDFLVFRDCWADVANFLLIFGVRTSLMSDPAE